MAIFKISEDRKKLKITLENGEVIQVWIEDGKLFYAKT